MVKDGVREIITLFMLAKDLIQCSKRLLAYVYWDTKQSINVCILIVAICALFTI